LFQKLRFLQILVAKAFINPSTIHAYDVSDPRFLKCRKKCTDTATNINDAFWRKETNENRHNYTRCPQVMNGLVVYVSGHAGPRKEAGCIKQPTMEQKRCIRRLSAIAIPKFSPAEIDFASLDARWGVNSLGHPLFDALERIPPRTSALRAI
jgi:hypothetical protein